MQANRRKFLSLLGVGTAAGPLAAKAAAEREISQIAGIVTHRGRGNYGLGLPTGGAPGSDGGSSIPYEQRLIGAADYIKLFGVPEHLEVNLRDQAKYVGSIDVDIASKRSWSMSVKVLAQRERNYERLVERIKVAGWQERGRQTLKKVLGFDWPW